MYNGGKFEAILAKRLSQFELHLGALASIPMLVQGFTIFENSILSRTQSVASITNNISNIEQAVGGLAARVAALEAGAASASSGSGSARSWNIFGQSDGSRATGSTAQDHLTTTGTQDVDLILSPAQRINMHEFHFASLSM